MLLSGPVNALTDFQAEFNGLLMGPGTPYDFPPSLDWLDMPAVKTMDQARTGADGSWSGPDFADVRTITATVEIKAAPVSAFEAACVAYLQHFPVQTTDRPLWMKLPGFPIMGIGARVSKRTLPIDIGFELGTIATAAVQWRAPNPAWQSVARSASLQPGTATSGLHFPLFLPYSGSGTYLDFGTTSQAATSATLTNAGNTPARPYVTVSGPILGGFTVAIDGHPVTYSADLASGDIVTIDYATGRATLSSGGSAAVDRTYLLTARNFTSIPAGGSSTVTFGAASGTCTVTTADLWR